MDFCGDDFVKNDLLAQFDDFHANHSFDSAAMIQDFVAVQKYQKVKENC